MPSSRRRIPMRTFHAQVVEVSDVSPWLRRVVFGGPDLRAFHSTGVGDEYVRMVFPTKPWQRPALPVVVGDDLDYGSVDRGRLRTYTVRAFDPRSALLTIDFVLHPDGTGAGWVRQAQPGQVVGLSSPTGLYDPPPGITRRLLVTDVTGLPAAARLVEGAAAGVCTTLVVEIPDASARMSIAEHPGLDTHWVIGAEPARSRLAELVRSLPVPGPESYVWVAGETRALRDVRSYLRGELGLPAAQYKAVGYWTADVAAGQAVRQDNNSHRAVPSARRRHAQRQGSAAHDRGLALADR